MPETPNNPDHSTLDDQKPEVVDCRCGRCKDEGKGTYETTTKCMNCGWEGVAIHSLGHEKSSRDECPHCECRKLYHGDRVEVA